MEEKFGYRDGELNFTSGYIQADHYFSVWFENLDIPDDLTPEARKQVEEIFRDTFYEADMASDLAIKLATSRFNQFLNDTMGGKIEAILNQSDEEYYQNLKFMYLSAHDSSLTAILAGLEQVQEEQSFFASHIIFELWQERDPKSAEDFQIRMFYNDKEMNIGGKNT